MGQVGLIEALEQRGLFGCIENDLEIIFCNFVENTSLVDMWGCVHMYELRHVYINSFKESWKRGVFLLFFEYALSIIIIFRSKCFGFCRIL